MVTLPLSNERLVRVLPIFFFSSRRRHTRSYGDWSSDVCSSDLVPANLFAAVEITTLPTHGSLELAGAPVTAGQFVSVADLGLNKLKFTPALNANGPAYASFSFQVQDDGATANGGVDTDQSANTLTIDVTSVNDAPQGADNTVSTLEDTALTLHAAAFGFTDVNDVPANLFAAVEITTLPTHGSLELAGAPVTAGKFASAADLLANKLKFTPALNANGAAYASFSFQLHSYPTPPTSDLDTDQSANTLTIDVT